ncbi:IPT/TIG domain-containing protein [Streptomyces sp. NPDC015125]|uniref:IPT/TIG domain-containing protein n=1 Tax=Streptomyces sp. NPDC015125 TaxID=3364938 RepID=UPI0036F74C44
MAIVNPSSGPASGGNTVLITGTGLTGATSVHFGSPAATSLSVISPTQLTAVAPAGTGTVQVTVTTPSGTIVATPSYTYISAPVITSVAPSSGGGGATVAISGTGFTDATDVQFGSVPATSWSVVSATQIVAVAPPGTGSVLVTVTAPGGISNGVEFVYAGGPALAIKLSDLLDNIAGVFHAIADACTTISGFLRRLGL